MSPLLPDYSPLSALLEGGAVGVGAHGAGDADRATSVRVGASRAVLAKAANHRLLASGASGAAKAVASGTCSRAHRCTDVRRLSCFCCCAPAEAACTHGRVPGAVMRCSPAHVHLQGIIKAGMMCMCVCVCSSPYTQNNLPVPQPTHTWPLHQDALATISHLPGTRRRP